MADEVQVFEMIGGRGGSSAAPVTFLAKQSLDIDGAASAAFNRSANQIRIISTTGCVVEFGAAPDGLGVTYPIVAGQINDFSIVAGQKVIAVAGTATAPAMGLPAGAATSAKQDTIIGHVDGIEAALTAANASLDAIEAKQVSGPSTAATSQSVVPSTDQNPIFDHAAGTKSSVTASATIITTGAGHTFLRISSNVDIYVSSEAAAVDDGTSILIHAAQPEIIPVPPSTAIKALSSSGTATVRCTPLKVR